MMKHRSQYVTLWSDPPERSTSTNGRLDRGRPNNPGRPTQPVCRIGGVAREAGQLRIDQLPRRRPRSPTPRARALALIQCERNRIARDLHDHAGQIITTCILRLDLLIKKHPTAYPGQTDDLRSVRTLLNTYAHNLREIAYDLRSRPVDTVDFGTSLELYAHEVGNNAGLKMNITIDPGLPQLPETTELAIYRAFQEALTNVVKHATAREVWLNVYSETGTLTLVIEDNGRGFSPRDARYHSAEYSHLGLIGMQERLETIGGKLSIESAPGQGTRITIVVPTILPALRRRLRRVK